MGKYLIHAYPGVLGCAHCCLKDTHPGVHRTKGPGVHRTKGPGVHGKKSPGVHVEGFW